MAACIALFIVCGYIIVSLHNRSNKLAAHINQLESKQKAVTEKLVVLQNKADNSQRKLLAISNPNTFPVVMKGLSISPQSLSTVYWNGNSKEAFLSVNSLNEICSWH